MYNFKYFRLYWFKLCFLCFFESCAADFGNNLFGNTCCGATHPMVRCLCHSVELHRNVADFTKIYGKLDCLDCRQCGLCGHVCGASQLLLGCPLHALSRDVVCGLGRMAQAPPSTAGSGVACLLAAILYILFLTF